MRALIQRVSHASVVIDGETRASIRKGYVVLLGVRKGDLAEDAEFLASKCAHLRVMEDPEGKMNLSLGDVGGSVIVVSQFTLYGDIIRGRRPSFDKAALPGDARLLYEYFVHRTKEFDVKVETGRFQAAMDVTIRNFGPVTIFCDTFDRRK